MELRIDYGGLEPGAWPTLKEQREMFAAQLAMWLIPYRARRVGCVQLFAGCRTVSADVRVNRPATLSELEHAQAVAAMGVMRVERRTYWDEIDREQWNAIMHRRRRR